MSTKTNRPIFTSYGGLDEVTGSKHIYTTYRNGHPFRVLLDCGSLMGFDKTNQDNMHTGIPQGQDLNAVILSHSHLDHCGQLPVLQKEGFQGNIYATEDTIKNTIITLKDSASIFERQINFHTKLSEVKTELRRKRHFMQEHQKEIDAGTYHYDHEAQKRIAKAITKKIINMSIDEILEYHNPENILAKYRQEFQNLGIKSPADIDNFGKICDKIIPYTTQDVKNLEKLFVPIEYDQYVSLGDGLGVKLYNAGHILGSAQVLIKDDLYGKTLFTGDLGRIREPLYLTSPDIIKNVKNLIIESTYGGRNHKNRELENNIVLELIKQTKSHILRADFANQRHQDDHQWLLDMKKQHDFIPNIICDGFTAQSFTHNIISHHAYELLAESKIHRAAGAPQEKLNNIGNRSLIISSSGMLSAGPITNYLHKILQDKDALLIIPGFQAPGTIGEKIIKTNRYSLGNCEYAAKCKVYQFSSRSNHADQNDIFQYVEKTNPKNLFAVHGPADQRKILQETLKGVMPHITTELPMHYKNYVL